MYVLSSVLCDFDDLAAFILIERKKSSTNLISNPPSTSSGCTLSIRLHIILISCSALILFASSHIRACISDRMPTYHSPSSSINCSKKGICASSKSVNPILGAAMRCGSIFLNF